VFIFDTQLPHEDVQFPVVPTPPITPGERLRIRAAVVFLQYEQC